MANPEILREFVIAEGAVHLALGEFTLCGDAFDLGSDEPGYEWAPTKRRTVTCEGCSAIIRACRGVRTASQGGENASLTGDPLTE